MRNLLLMVLLLSSSGWAAASVIAAFSGERVLAAIAVAWTVFFMLASIHDMITKEKP